MPFAAIDNLTDLPGLTIAGTAALLGLLLAGRVTSAVFFAVSVGGVWVLNPVLKDLFERPRPDPWPTTVSVSEFSFPSGHAANTAALVIAFVLALQRAGGGWALHLPVLTESSSPEGCGIGGSDSVAAANGATTTRLR